MENYIRPFVVGRQNWLFAALVSIMDFAVVEECFRYDECEAYSPLSSPASLFWQRNIQYSGKPPAQMRMN
jgi:hypothetical protein